MQIGIGLSLSGVHGPGAGASAASYRYWRILISDNDGNADYVSMSRFVLYEGATDRSTAQSGTGTTNSSIGPTEIAAYALNGNLANEWIGLKSALPVWVAVDLGAEYAITRYEVSSQGGTTGRTPTAWKVQGSNTSQTGPWTDADEQSAQTAWGIQETRSYGM